MNIPEGSVLSFYIFLIAFPILLGLTFGRFIEWRHYRSLKRREESLSDILVFSTVNTPEDLTHADLVSAAAVISQDAFKAVLAAIRNIFGGNIETYESLFDRARREAIIRLKNSAKNQNANMIFNVKLVTSNIASGSGKTGLVAVEVLAFGTAFRRTE